MPISRLEASFIFENPEVNFSVAFTNTSAGNPDTFLWNFGDGTSSSERKPAYEVPEVGTTTTYGVRLTVSKVIGATQLSDTTSTVPGSAPPEGCDVTIEEEEVVIVGP